MPDAEALAFLEEMAVAPLFTPGEWVQLAISEASDERLVGDIGVFIAEDKRHAEIGFTLESSVQGRGIATAAVREAIKLIFQRTTVAEILGITDSRNLASIRLLERLGFTQHAIRQAVFRGEPCSELVYALRREDS